LLSVFCSPAEAGVIEDGHAIRCEGVDTSMLLSVEAGGVEDAPVVRHAGVDSSSTTSGLCASDAKPVAGLFVSGFSAPYCTTVEDAPSTCLRSTSPGDGDADGANAFKLSVPVGVRGVDGDVKLHKLSDSS